MSSPRPDKSETRDDQSRTSNPSLLHFPPHGRGEVPTAAPRQLSPDVTEFPPQSPEEIKRQEEPPEDIQIGFHPALVHRPPTPQPAYAKFGGAWSEKRKGKEKGMERSEKKMGVWEDVPLDDGVWRNQEGSQDVDGDGELEDWVVVGDYHHERSTKYEFF